MNAEETEIFEFLKTRGANYVSVAEISKALGHGRRYQKDRFWARPVLRRMEVDGVLESNPYGEYRIKGGAETEPEAPANDFKEALRNPDASLGDTTIIRIQDT
jgi:hypothetical protein